MLLFAKIDKWNDNSAKYFYNLHFESIFDDTRAGRGLHIVTGEFGPRECKVDLGSAI